MASTMAPSPQQPDTKNIPQQSSPLKTKKRSASKTSSSFSKKKSKQASSKRTALSTNDRAGAVSREGKQSSSKSGPSAPARTNDSNSKKKFILFAGNLPYDATPTQLQTLLRPTLPLLTKTSAFTNKQTISVRLLTKKGSNDPRGCAFLEFPCARSMQKALHGYHKASLGGRKINLEIAAGGGSSSGQGAGSSSGGASAGRSGGEGTAGEDGAVVTPGAVVTTKAVAKNKVKEVRKRLGKERRKTWEKKQAKAPAASVSSGTEMGNKTAEEDAAADKEAADVPKDAPKISAKKLSLSQRRELERKQEKKKRQKLLKREEREGSGVLVPKPKKEVVRYDHSAEELKRFRKKFRLNDQGVDYLKRQDPAMLPRIDQFCKIPGKDVRDPTGWMIKFSEQLKREKEVQFFGFRLSSAGE